MESMAKKRILYIFPDRDSEMEYIWERDAFWPDYRRQAEQVGMDFGVANPEHIMIAGREAFWKQEPLHPARDILVYDIRPEPPLTTDLWSSISLVRSLETLGFWSAIPLQEAVLFNDKFATAEALSDSPIPIIPSVRVVAGRDIHKLDYQRLVPDSWFPVFVKPASWGRGLGCVRCGDRATLDAVMGLASGSDATMLIQPSVGEVKADIRVVVIEGEIVAMYDRVPGAQSHVANLSRGGSVVERVTLDAPVDALVRLISRRFDISYLCIDLLMAADGRIWLSELELDGAVSALFGDPEAMKRVVGRRFQTYAERLDRHLSRQRTTHLETSATTS